MPGSGLDIMIDTGKLSELERLYCLYVLVPNWPHGAQKKPSKNH